MKHSPNIRKSMKKYWILAILPLAFALCACSASATLKKTLNAIGTTGEEGQPSARAEVYFPALGHGENRYVLRMDDANPLLAELMAALGRAGRCRQMPSAPYAPQASSDVHIIIEGQDGSAYLYYDTAANLLSLRQEKTDRDGNTQLEYAFLTPGEDFAALTQQIMAQSSLEFDDTATQMQSLDELKALLDRSYLDVTQAREITCTQAPEDFMPQAMDCRALANMHDAAIPQGQVVFCALYADPAGQPAQYDILGVYANDRYTLVRLVSLLADESEMAESGTTDENATEAGDDIHGLVMCDSGEIDFSKWVVFVDTDNVVKGVVVPGEWGLANAEAT